MNILIPNSWLRDFLKTSATPKQIQEALSLSSASIERLHKDKEDYIYDIEVTTNRPDLMSIAGIAIEASAVLPRFNHRTELTRSPYNLKVNLKLSSDVKYLKVKIDPVLCKRFTAVLISNVTVKPSPPKIIKRLEQVGMRGLNNVVDISNYLMHEMGQPVHTFDYDKIKDHRMILRESKKGEKLTTLDGKTHTLPGGDIVIEDGSGELIDLCGIMGGGNSSVTESTKNVLLFVQTYDPGHIRRTSMNLAHRTSAAVLFEKSLPPENVLPTLKQGMDMFKDLTGGVAEDEIIDIYPSPTSISTVKIKIDLTEFINNRLGINLSFKEIKDILTRLNFRVISPKEVEVPAQRIGDISIPEDLVEEVARIYGYHNLPSKLMPGQLPTNRGEDKIFYWENKVKNILKHWGFTETYTYSLVGKEIESDPDALKLRNPLSSDWEYLRTKLLPSHLKVVAENAGRVKELKLFEIANVYIPRRGDLPEEELHLVITTTNLNTLLLKGVIEGLSLELGTQLPAGEIIRFTEPKCLGYEVNLKNILNSATASKTFVPISKFSPIIEDINIEIKSEVQYSDLTEKIKSLSKLIQKTEFVDKYNNKLTLRITFHSNDKQLSSEDVSELRDRIANI